MAAGGRRFGPWFWLAVILLVGGLTAGLAAFAIHSRVGVKVLVRNQVVEGSFETTDFFQEDSPSTSDAPPDPPPDRPTWFTYRVSGDVKRGGGERVFDFRCDGGFLPVGLEPTTSFPAAIRVQKVAPEYWRVSVINLHGTGKERPVLGKATLTLVCAKQQSGR